MNKWYKIIMDVTFKDQNDKNIYYEDSIEIPFPDTLCWQDREEICYTIGEGLVPNWMYEQYKTFEEMTINFEEVGHE